MDYKPIPLKSKNDFFKNIPGSVYHCQNDQYFTMIDTNEEFLDLVGFSCEEIAMRFQNRLLEMIHPFEREDVIMKLEERLSNCSKCTSNYRILCKDGSYKWILDHCRIVKDAENQETIIGIMLETTEIENTREALELTLDRHRVIMEQTSDILFEWDITTDKVLCSSHWKEKFGYELGIYKLSDCYQLPYLHPDDLPKVEKLSLEIQSRNPYLTTELRIRQKEGDYLWCRIRISNQFDEWGCLNKVIGVIQDIDEEKRMIENLRRRAERDALTGLYNRAETQKQIKNYLNRNQMNTARCL